MTENIDRQKEGIRSPIDILADTGHEQKLTSFTFDDLGHELFYAQWDKKKTYENNVHGGKYQGYGLSVFRYFKSPETGKPDEPQLSLGFSPFVIKGQTTATVLFFPVNSARDAHPISIDWEELNLRRYGSFDGFALPFHVYDIDFDKIDDPTYLKECVEIRAGSVSAASNLHSAGKHRGWVTNPYQRARINEWFQADVQGTYENKERIKQYIQLRQTVFNIHNSPQFGDYTYEGVKDDVINGSFSSAFVSTESGLKPLFQEAFHHFTPQDLEWLEEFMKNKGIPIPGK